MRWFLSCWLMCLATVSQADTILIVGDSISAAYGIDKSAGWVSLLENKLPQACDHVKVKNVSVSGETTAGGLARLPGLLEKHAPALVVIELGGNDGLRGLSPAVMQQNLQQMIRLSRAAGAEVVVLGIYIPLNLGDAYRAMFTRAFNEAVSAEQVPFLPFFLDQVFDRPEYMQRDGLHPTAAAQPQMLENAWKVMAEPVARLCPQLADR